MSLAKTSSSYPSTSLSLLLRARAGEALAWHRLVQLYSPLVYNWARRTGVPAEDAADVTQETFAVVASRLKTFDDQRDGATFRGWLWTITRNKSADWARDRGKQPEAVGGSWNRIRLDQQSAPVANQADDSACTALNSSDQMEIIQRALAMIRGSFQKKTWQAFWRTVVDECSPEEVADELGISKWTVYKARSRVLMRLRSELDGLEELP